MAISEQEGIKVSPISREDKPFIGDKLSKRVFFYHLSKKNKEVILFPCGGVGAGVGRVRKCLLYSGHLGSL